MNPLVLTSFGIIATLLIALLVNRRELQKFAKEKSTQSYMDVWKQLSALKHDMEALWKKADRERLNRFIDSLNKTSLLIEESSILLEQRHYQKLRLALQELGYYQLGKEQLVNYRDRTSANASVYDLVPERVIEENGQARDAYLTIIKEVETTFRKHLERG